MWMSRVMQDGSTSRLDPTSNSTLGRLSPRSEIFQKDLAEGIRYLRNQSVPADTEDGVSMWGVRSIEKENGCEK